jgi:hypothetical protein
MAMGFNPGLSGLTGLRVAADTQRVGDAIDVVEPRRDQRDLKDAPVVEAYGTQPIVEGRRDAGGIASNLLDVLEHHPILFRDGGRPEIGFERLDERFIQRDTTQKLCVGLQSILAPVRDRDDRRDHLLLAPRERQIWRRQHAECRERMEEGIGDQGV